MESKQPVTIPEGHQVRHVAYDIGGRPLGGWTECQIVETHTGRVAATGMSIRAAARKLSATNS